MTKRLVLILITLVLTASCGFKPIHKLSDTSGINTNYSVNIINSVSREIREEINANIVSDGNEKYSALLTITDSLTPLIINTNGTVAKYRVEIQINYILTEAENGKEISNGMARGSAQYDVGTSEINNEDMKKSMTKTATKSAIQLMVSKLRSSISRANDN